MKWIDEGNQRSDLGIGMKKAGAENENSPQSQSFL